ncbi:hypothetical protein [Streptomyces sp. MMBL 11-1]|uniref:hypothetical protein n=1 Tax=Streptomyces sp. MMBL 11-1 TaxID=3026420 RepID=UPI002360ABD2|nr:hypothetical protein [Streptomyces sp. MMBL 11-1]
MTTPTALTCTLAPHADTRALRLTLINTTAQHATCTQITLTRHTTTVDSPAAHAEPAPEVTATDGSVWEPHPDGQHRHHLRPSAPTVLAPGARLHLLLDGLRPSQGSARISATPYTPDGAAPQSDPHTVTSGTETITGFWSDTAHVAPGKDFTLNWTAALPLPPGLKFHLCYGDQLPIDVTHQTKPDKGAAKGTWTCKEGVQDTTAFALLATHTLNNDTITSGRTMAISVSTPNLTTGQLRADGKVALLTEPVTLIDDTKALGTPQSVEKKAGTDGFIAARIRPVTGGANAFAAVQVTAPNKVAHRAEALSPEATTPRNLLVPVPQGSTLNVQTRTEKGDYLAQVTWYPMGRGSLA